MFVGRLARASVRQVQCAVRSQLRWKVTITGPATLLADARPVDAVDISTRTFAQAEHVSEYECDDTEAAQGDARSGKNRGHGWLDPSTYRETQRPVDDATTLPGAVYHDPNFAVLERNRLWRSSWVAAAETVDLSNPGDVVPVTIGGVNIILTNSKGTIHGFHNVCRHRGAQLVSERCTKRKTILCPYHRWGYALDGRLMGTPSWDADELGKSMPEHIRAKFSTGHVRAFDKKKMGLIPVSVDTALGLVFVNVDGEAPSLEEWLGDLLPMLDDYRPALENDLVPAHRKTYTPEANWKVLVENFLEYYHLPAVHPALCDVSGVDEHERRQGTGMYMAFGTFPLTQGGTALDPGRLPPFRELKEENKSSAYHIAIFPNVFFSLYPDNFFRVILQPGETPSQTVEHATLLSHTGAIDAPNADRLLQETYDFWDNVNTEDIGICEKVQVGTRNAAYTGGRFSFRFEETLHRFQNMVIDKILAGENKYRIPKGDEPKS